MAKVTREEDLKEMRELSKEFARRDQAIVDEWKRTHKMPGRGTIITPEREALNAEFKERYFAILKRYTTDE